MIRIPHDKVAIIPIRDSDKIGHIWIPDTAKERTDQGIVKYVGPDVKWCTPGMYVTFSGYSGTLLYIADPDRPNDPGETVIILKEDFIFCELSDLPPTDVPGLFFRGVDGSYFQANVEQSLELISRAINDADWRHYNPVTGSGINVKSEKVKPEEFEKMRGG